MAQVISLDAIQNLSYCKLPFQSDGFAMLLTRIHTGSEKAVSHISYNLISYHIAKYLHNSYAKKAPKARSDPPELFLAVPGQILFSGMSDPHDLLTELHEDNRHLSAGCRSVRAEHPVPSTRDQAGIYCPLHRFQRPI